VLVQCTAVDVWCVGLSGKQLCLAGSTEWINIPFLVGTLRDPCLIVLDGTPNPPLGRVRRFDVSADYFDHLFVLFYKFCSCRGFQPVASVIFCLVE